jgi:hypothetical protein
MGDFSPKSPLTGDFKKKHKQNGTVPFYGSILSLFGRFLLKFGSF